MDYLEGAEGIAVIDPRHLTLHVIRPVLKSIGLYSFDAEKLMLGTACKESECGRWLVQLGDGPALGIFQMEPDTYKDCWDNFLVYNPELAGKVKLLTANLRDTEMVGNHYFATAMARIKYRRDREDIPDYLAGQAQYYKRVYNTPAGASTIQEYIQAWNRFVSPHDCKELWPEGGETVV